MVLALFRPGPVRASLDPDPLFDEPEASPTARVSDPLESVNRGVLHFNLVIGDWVLDPLSRAYAWVVPGPARLAIRRALHNLDDPAIFANDVLQGSPVDAGTTLIRFVLNTSIGIGGLFDPAEAMRFPGHQNDFGTTLGIAGVPTGPYMIVPLLGPTTARDATGVIVDFMFRPTTYLLTPPVAMFVTGIRDGTLGFATYEAHAQALEALEASSVDFYSTLRSAYLQDADARLRARRDAPYRLVNLWRDDSAGGARTLSAPGGEVGDLLPNRRDERIEAAAVQY